MLLSNLLVVLFLGNILPLYSEPALFPVVDADHGTCLCEVSRHDQTIAAIVAGTNQQEYNRVLVLPGGAEGAPEKYPLRFCPRSPSISAR